MRVRVLLWLFALLVCGACKKLEPRPGDEHDGSARWAMELAQPSMARWSADAEVREMLGASVGLDGRLAANGGAWSVVAYSPSRGETLQALVQYDSKVSTTTRAEAAPGPGVVQPQP